MLRLLLGVLILCSGCMGGDSLEEIKEKITAIESQKGELKIEEIPEALYFPQTYDGGTLRDPFSPFETLLDSRKNRTLEYLEQFPIDALRMVGVLEQDGTRFALIEDKSGTLSRVMKGSYIGPNGGIVYNILPDRILILERIVDSSAGWVEHHTEIEMVESNP